MDWDAGEREQELSALKELADLSLWLKSKADEAEANMKLMQIGSIERVSWSHRAIAFQDALKEVGVRMYNLEQQDRQPGQLRFVLRKTDPLLMLRILQVYECRENAAGARHYGWYDVPLVNSDVEG